MFPFRFSFILVCFSLLAGSISQGSPIAARFICSQINSNPQLQFKTRFSEEFQALVPESHLRLILQEVHEAVGSCQSVSPDGKDLYTLISETLGRVRIQVSAPIYQITSFSILSVERNTKLREWPDFRAELEALPGNVSLTLQGFDGDSFTFQENMRQPIASGFKLYVLGALAKEIRQGKLSWADTIPIQTKLKSLPTGKMQDLKAGTQVSLLESAQQMIQISDNTATDHLIAHLGRETIEAILPEMGNPFALENAPFLMTHEMMKLKWAYSPSKLKTYLSSSTSEKREILNTEIASIELSQIGKNGVDSSQPTQINAIEWFASSQSLCEAARWLRDFGDPKFESILGRNTPFVQAGAHWEFVGFKGGSEPGVLTLTYLLKSNRGKWGCLSFAWSHEERTVNSWIGYELVAKALKFSETVVK